MVRYMYTDGIKIELLSNAIGLVALAPFILRAHFHAIDTQVFDFHVYILYWMCPWIAQFKYN